MVTATNVKGDSEQSDVGSGGILLRGADVPFNIQEDLSLRTISTFGLTWSEGVDNGGAPVIDYRISVKTSGEYYVYISALTTTSFTAVSLTKGTLYTVKI